MFHRVDRIERGTGLMTKGIATAVPDGPQTERETVVASRFEVVHRAPHFVAAAIIASSRARPQSVP
jgi:hypothetical protein